MITTDKGWKRIKRNDKKWSTIITIMYAKREVFPSQIEGSPRKSKNLLKSLPNLPIYLNDLVLPQKKHMEQKKSLKD